MAFLKIGAHYLNTDWIAHVEPIRDEAGKEGLMVRFGIGSGSSPGMMLRGTEAEALLRWLERKAKDLAAPRDRRESDSDEDG